MRQRPLPHLTHITYTHNNKTQHITGITVLSRDKSSGELGVAQQFKIDQVCELSFPFVLGGARTCTTHIPWTPTHHSTPKPRLTNPQPQPTIQQPQNAGVEDIDGMIGANSVAVSPDGKFAYVSSGGYYRGAYSCCWILGVYGCALFVGDGILTHVSMHPSI